MRNALSCIGTQSCDNPQIAVATKMIVMFGSEPVYLAFHLVRSPLSRRGGRGETSDDVPWLRDGPVLQA
jgi:hypothetical protein